MIKKSKFKQQEKRYRLNERIFAATLRVIDAESKQIGVLSKDEALRLAREQELDLVGIAPMAKPPVAKIIDYNKFQYQLAKKKQEEKKKNKKKKIDKKNQKKDEFWKKKAPEPNDDKTKQVRNRTYHWCEHHMSWTIHKPTDCRWNPTHPEYQPPRPRQVQAAAAQPSVEPPAQTHEATARAAMINFLDQLQAISDE